MSNLETSITNYMKNAEKAIQIQKNIIANLKETITAKNELHNTLIEYIQKIYDNLTSKDPVMQAEAMWHLNNLAYPKETK